MKCLRFYTRYIDNSKQTNYNRPWTLKSSLFYFVFKKYVMFSCKVSCNCLVIKHENKILFYSHNFWSFIFLLSLFPSSNNFSQLLITWNFFSSSHENFYSKLPKHYKFASWQCFTTASNMLKLPWNWTLWTVEEFLKQLSCFACI